VTMAYGSSECDAEGAEGGYQAETMDRPTQPTTVSASRSGVAMACVAAAAFTAGGAYVAVSRASMGGLEAGVAPPTIDLSESMAMKLAKPLGELTCDEFDDDTIYPNDGCNFGDSAVCENEVYNSEHYYHFCGAACVEEEMKMRADNVRPSSLYVNASWAVVCGWEAVVSLPDVCQNNFTSYIPSSSENKAPRYSSKDEAPASEFVTNTSVDACNLHAFCVACEFSDHEEESTYNKYCKAMTGYYGSGSLYMLTNFFNHLDKFWCHEDVLESIEKGTFAHKFHDPYSSMLGRKESDSVRVKGRQSPWPARS